MKIPAIVPLEFLHEEPYSSVLCFPTPSELELQSRIEELRKLWVSALEFTGNASVFGVRLAVLGKGYVGIVVIGHLNNQMIAVKIRRLDSGREDLLHEAQMLSKANSVHVGPTLIGASKNFLLMQLINGDLLTSWLTVHKEKGLVKRVLSDVLEQCYRLDELGLDHGEISKATKHVIIDQNQKPFLVDFETASVERRVSNVSAMCQFFFTGSSAVRQLLVETLGERNRLDVIGVLRKYKKSISREDFDDVLRVCFS
jgi:putative serine/threonine protein kinase